MPTPGVTGPWPPYVQLPEAVLVLVDGPRGRFRGVARGYAGDRVYCSWTEGIGETYIGWFPAEMITRRAA